MKGNHASAMNLHPRRVSIFLLLAVAATAALWPGCKPREGGSPRTRPLVIASFYPLYDFARAVGGTNFEVVCLVSPGADPHAMEATPAEAKTVSQAGTVLLLGLGMDSWLEKLAASTRTRRVVLSEGIPTRKLGRPALSEFASEKEDPNEIDPHLWLDPVIAEKLVARIAGELAQLAPAHAAEIQSRAGEYRAELQTLDEEFTAATARLPRRRVVTFHGAFGYLFARYGLETAGVIEMFPGDEPSAAYLRALVDLMRKLGLKVIFAEPQLPDQPAQVIAREIGGRVKRLDPCETILPDSPDATYVQRQRQNLATLRRALGGN